MLKIQTHALTQIVVLSILSIISIRARASEGALDTPEYWKPAQQEIASLGDGFIVWETHRTGRWTIWIQRLDGTGQKQLSADEPDRDHAGVKISPNGKRAVYLAFTKQPPAEDGCPAPLNKTVPLHIVNTDGTGDRVIVPDARSYSGWQRSVTWFDNDELAYISADGNTYQLNVDTGKSTLLIKRFSAESPSWLPDPMKKYAVWSFGTFSPLDMKLQMVKPLPHMGGCQPYFTQDGEWGFWESYCGGPIGTCHLSSWILGGDRTLSVPSLARSMMPSPHRDYIYFAMYSADKRLLAFAARDHEAPGGYGKADWDIFVVKTNPANLQVIGKPVRYTFDPECDRFPDVWQAPLALGFQSVKAPHTAAFNFPEGDAAAWDYGDGTTEKAVKGSHAYTKPGLYSVSATRGETVWHGQVYVQEAAPPKALRALLKDNREIAVIFNEPVNLAHATATLASNAKIEAVKAGEDGWSLRIIPAQMPQSGDAVHIEGVTDFAQHPNPMPAVEMPFDVRVWPSTRAGLVFLWQGSNKPNILHDSDKGDLSCGVIAKGRAWYSHDRDMIIDGGSFTFPGLSEVFSEAIQKSNAFTIELSISCTQGDEKLPRSLMSYGLTDRGQKIMLRHGDKEVYVSPAGGYVALTYKDGHLITYNGINRSLNTNASGQFEAQVITDTDKFPLDLKTFAANPLILGNNSEGESWERPANEHGPGLTIRSIAIYDRALSNDELSRNVRGRTTMENTRMPVPDFSTSAGVIEVSKMPLPKEIAPYTRAMCMYEYEINDNPDPKKRHHIRVAHWVLFDKQFERVAQIPLKGDTDLMNLEAFDVNKQFEGEYISDTLEPNPDIPTYFCPRERRVTRGGTLEVDLMGPFKVADADALEAPTELEKNLVNVNKTYKPEPGLQWKTFRIPYVSNGFFDVASQYPSAEGNVAYAHYYYKTPTARKAILNLETVGGVKVWLNGKSVSSFKSDRSPARLQKREAVELNAGFNEILIKVIKGDKRGGWGFICDVLDTQGREMQDAQFTTDVDKPARGVN